MEFFFVSFEAIWTFFHACNNDTRPSNCNDRMFKVRPLLDIIIPKFRTAFTPHREVSIDEAMLLWRGRLAFRVYNPAKPIKYGVKSYVLADSTTGYCWNILPYCGVSAPITHTVPALMDRLLDHGHRLYMDNFYNSVTLTTMLLSRKTDVCGTLRSHRGEPPAIRNPTLEKGERVAMHNGTCMVLTWK